MNAKKKMIRTKIAKHKLIKEKGIQKQFNELITQLGDEGLVELYEECYPNEIEKDYEREIIEYFDWNDDNPKRQKELLDKLKEILEE